MEDIISTDIIISTVQWYNIPTVLYRYSIWRGIIESIKRRTRKTRKQAQPPLVARDRIRGSMRATRVRYFALSLHADRVCPLSSRSTYVVSI
jgi:hypothetical protein